MWKQKQELFPLSEQDVKERCPAGSSTTLVMYWGQGAEFDSGRQWCEITTESLHRNSASELSDNAVRKCMGDVVRGKFTVRNLLPASDRARVSVVQLPSADVAGMLAAEERRAGNENRNKLGVVEIFHENILAKGNVHFPLG